MFNFNIEFAVECVKSISDNTQCVTCDKFIGPCVRFSCGHSVCEGCAQRTGECMFCVSSAASYRIDKPLTARFENTSALLTAFQDTFKIDVFKRQRISDHLKVEKIVFPECIQAPHKYTNKRKSSLISLKDKENLNPKIFPGESIKSSDTIIMKKSVQYVQNWLNQHESIPQNLPRRPFGDININTPLIPKTKTGELKLRNVSAQINAKQPTSRKRSHLKSMHKTSSLIKNDLEIKHPQMQLEIKKEERSHGNSDVSYKCDKNESGIVLDDEPIVLENKDTNIVDKDRQAWLDVLKAAEKDEFENKEKNMFQKEKVTNKSLEDYGVDGSTLITNANKSESSSRFPKNVLFYKKGSLFETCKLCNNYLKTKINPRSEVCNSNDVSIVINNSTFVTTIQFTHCEENTKTISNKNSVAMQTDKEMRLLKQEIINFDRNITPQKRKNNINNDVSIAPLKILKSNSIPQSLDVFATDKETKQNSPDNSLKQQKCLIIEDSDTDSNVSFDNTHEVVAEVHRSNAPESVECGILRKLSKGEYEHKTRRQKRGHTPNSSNSSDKENLDPNRKKVKKSGKKNKNKK